MSTVDGHQKKWFFNPQEREKKHYAKSAERFDNGTPKQDMTDKTQQIR